MPDPAHPKWAKPSAHIHNALFNVVVTDDGRVGSLYTQRLHARVHEFGAFFQAKLAEELRRLGARTAYDKDERAVVLEAIPGHASDAFSKGRKQVLRSARAYARRQGLEWDNISAKGKLKILSVSGSLSSVIGSSSVQVEARNSTLASRSDDHLRLHRRRQQISTTSADAI